MPASENLPTDELQHEDAELEGDSVEGEEGEEQPEKLNLDVNIASKSACQRHITVTIPREDVDRYFEKAFSELVGKASIPGFRAGRAPRKLVESRFKKEVAAEVKGSLLMDSLAQVTEEKSLAAISEPDLDPTGIEVPDEGPFVYEFDLEVRPEFDLPNWKGLTLERPVREFTDKDVTNRMKSFLEQHGQLAPHEGPAESGDYVTVNLSFTHEGKEISNSKDEVIRLRPTLSFRDGQVEKFDKLLSGVKAGETRTGPAKLSMDAPNPDLRGKEITAVFEVLEVKKLEMPDLTPAFLEDLGGFESEEELRAGVKETMERKLAYEQRQRVRQQITNALTAAASWELPPELLKRQAAREFERTILELRRSGFSEQEIRQRANELRQNSSMATARSLKEHFILEKIAEEEKVVDQPDDYETEIELIAAQSGESVRRVRAQIEKRGLMDTLRNQIIERKVVELIQSHAKFKDLPYQIDASESNFEAIDSAAAGGDEPEIPEAKDATGEPAPQQ